MANLQTSHPADIYLGWRVTDYGETPVSWRGTYVALEVVSTLAITGALYVHTNTRPLAGIYLLQESVEELSEGYVGFWALNRLSRPVRIEADLIDGRDGRVLWAGSETGLAHWHWRSLWRKGEAVRSELLDVSARKVTADLAADVCVQVSTKSW